jgi:hypothetical protein
MKVFDFIDQFITKLVDDAMFILRHLFFFIFGAFVGSILWKTGMFGKITLLVIGFSLISVSATTAYCKLKQKELDKKLEEASKELHKKAGLNLLEKVSSLTLFRQFITKSDDAGKDSQKPV